MSNEYAWTVYIRSLGNDPYVSAVNYATDEDAARIAAEAEVSAMQKRGWLTVKGWCPADGRDIGQQWMLETETPIGTWNMIVGIAPSRWFRALV